MRRALLILGVLLVAVGGLAVILTAGRALPYHFPRGTEACFGRVYDDAFLAAHPTHRISELYLFRDFSSASASDRGGTTRAQMIAADRASSDDLWVNVLARFKDKPGAYFRSVACTNDVFGAACNSDCEGANFDIYPDGRGLAFDRTSEQGFVHLEGTSGRVDMSARLRFKKDGVDYRLDPMPVEACLAAFDRSAERN